MSAIEILNIWVSKPIIFDESFMTKDDYVEQVNLKVAVKEVLESLKQTSYCNEHNLYGLNMYGKRIRKLKEWLEKEIQYFEMRIGDKDFPNALGFRNKLREVEKELQGVKK